MATNESSSSDDLISTSDEEVGEAFLIMDQLERKKFVNEIVKKLKLSKLKLENKVSNQKKGMKHLRKRIELLESNLKEEEVIGERIGEELEDTKKKIKKGRSCFEKVILVISVIRFFLYFASLIGTVIPWIGVRKTSESKYNNGLLIGFFELNVVNTIVHLIFAIVEFVYSVNVYGRKIFESWRRFLYVFFFGFQALGAILFFLIAFVVPILMIYMDSLTIIFLWLSIIGGVISSVLSFVIFLFSL